MTQMRMFKGKGWKKFCPTTCGISAGAATHGMISLMHKRCFSLSAELKTW